MIRDLQVRRWLPFLPSLLFGVAGAVWVVLAPPRLAGEPTLWGISLWAALAAGGLLAGAWVLERTVPSFRWASRMLERALAKLRLSTGAALLLAALTAAGEELFFRGGLMQPLGVWGQALVFGALHPISRQGWAYTLYTVVAGLVFGYAALFSGSLWTVVLAHFVINLHGLLASRPRRR